VPEELRSVLRANQRDGYALLMKATAEAIIDIARDPRFVGGAVGKLAVLHTRTQQLLYHPPVHCRVTGGGVSSDGRDWYLARRLFFVPEMSLAELVCGKLRALLANKRPDLISRQCAPVVVSRAWSPNLLAISPSPTMTLKSPANRVFVRAAAEGTWCSF
jgi:hypothetical protein